jgi:hypothetical protein
MKRSVLSAAIATTVVAGLAVFASQAARQPLFAPGQARAALAADASYLALSSDRATASLELVQADAAQIAVGSDTLQLSVGNRPLFARRTDFVSNADGTSTWVGTLGKDTGLLGRLGTAFDREITTDPLNSVIIVRNGDKLTGSLRIDGALYSLQPLKSGGHVIARIDESKMPADHPVSYDAMQRDAIARSRKAKADAGTITPRALSTVRVMVVYSTAAASAVGDTLGKANLAISESNQGMVNSGSNVRFQLAGVYTANYVNSSFETDLSRFSGTTDGYLDSYHATRNSIAADVNVLITNNQTYCGYGYVQSTAATAFSVTSYSCMTGYYSFAHEIGHNFGALHDPQTSPQTTPYAYGHGYRSPTNAWRTIMAYNCTNAGGCPRINYWSNPAKTYGGQAMGTTAVSNNTRVLNERATTVAAFR